MSIGPVSSQNVAPTQRTAPTEGTDAAQNDTASKTDTPAAQAKAPASNDIVEGARQFMQGLGDNIKQQLDNLSKGQEFAGGKPLRPCGRGGRCTAQVPTRGLGGDNA